MSNILLSRLSERVEYTLRLSLRSAGFHEFLQELVIGDEYEELDLIEDFVRWLRIEKGSLKEGWDSVMFRQEWNRWHS